MISISHWGMFPTRPAPMIIPKGFKLSETDMAELRKPSGFVEIIPLAKGEPQPIYRAPEDGGWA